MKKETGVLEEYKLYYEDIKNKKRRVVKSAKTAKSQNDKKRVLANNINNKRDNVTGHVVLKFKNIHKRSVDVVNKVKHPSNKPKKLTKKEQEEANLLVREQRRRGIMGVGQLLVVVSIAYSTTVILIGVDSLESKIALLPQVIFALVILTKAFSKLYK